MRAQNISVLSHVTNIFTQKYWIYKILFKDMKAFLKKSYHCVTEHILQAMFVYD